MLSLRLVTRFKLNGLNNLSDEESIEGDFGIRTLYPIIGLPSTAVAFGFLYFGFSNPKVIRGVEKSKTDDGSDAETEEEKDLVRWT